MNSSLARRIEAIFVIEDPACLMARRCFELTERPAGLVLGHASLEAAQIDAGLRRLADALAALQPA